MGQLDEQTAQRVGLVRLGMEAGENVDGHAFSPWINRNNGELGRQIGRGSGPL